MHQYKVLKGQIERLDSSSYPAFLTLGKDYKEWYKKFDEVEVGLEKLGFELEVNSRYSRLEQAVKDINKRANVSIPLGKEQLYRFLDGYLRYIDGRQFDVTLVPNVLNNKD